METFVVHPDKFQGKALRAFLKALKVPFEIKKNEELPAHVLESLEISMKQSREGQLSSYNGIDDMLK